MPNAMARTARPPAPMRGRWAALLGVVSIVAFYLTALYSYPVFHTVVELFCMIVGGTIFVIAWHSRTLIERDYLLVIGLAMLGFVVLGVPHTLGYSGFSLFPGFDANMPTQIYLLQRFILAAAFVLAPLYLRRQMRAELGLAVLVGAVLLGVASIMWWRNFPDAFLPGTGLTAFKIVSEYVLIAMFVVAAILLWRGRRALHRTVFWLVEAAIAAFIISEFMFTLYSTPYSAANFVGHVSQVAAFGLLYLAVVRTALVRPYALLYRELANSERRYRRVAETLQTGLLHVPGQVDGLTIAHEYRAASDAARIGGDFYDVFTLKGGRIGVLLGDVSGKGLGAATITAQVKSMMRTLAEINARPSYVLTRANDILHQDLAEGQFVTLVYTLMDLSTGRMLQGSAGHPDPVICGGSRCTLEELPRNPPLGAIPDVQYEHAEQVIHPRECLVLYSDGISEARHEQEFFGDQRVHDTLAHLASAEPEELVAGLVAAALEFAHGNFTDDVAVLAVRLEETPGLPRAAGSSA